MLSQSPTKNFDGAQQLTRSKKQNTENSSLNFGMVRDSGKASTLSYAPRNNTKNGVTYVATSSQ